MSRSGLGSRVGCSLLSTLKWLRHLLNSTKHKTVHLPLISEAYDHWQGSGLVEASVWHNIFGVCGEVASPNFSDNPGM